MIDWIKQLNRALERAPVMGNFHPLMPLCLPPDVEVVVDPETVAERLDGLLPHEERSVLITRFDPRYKDRFLVWEDPRHPPVDAINRALPHQLRTARSHLLTNRNIANRIVTDAQQKGYQVVALLLVDGLSYADTGNWPEHPEPCFIDGPSITFDRTPEEVVAPDIGFPAIVGTPPLARRLADIGILHSRGYSYWDREQNDVSALLFQGMPLARVSGIADALDALTTTKLGGLYLQLVREGLDGLAHSRREVTIREVQATVEAIRNDYRRLIGLLAGSGLKGAAYLTADHGILWKTQHEFRQIEGISSRHPRYALESTLDSGFVSRFEMQRQIYYLCHYPYLGSRIRANESGVHGGLSYWESIVPFVHVEVNP